jgi:hypothetical protein
VQRGLIGGAIYGALESMRVGDCIRPAPWAQSA